MKNRTDALWQAYRTSFRRFAWQASLVQNKKREAPAPASDLQWDAALFTASPRGLDGVRDTQLEQARAAYTRARNELASALLEPRRPATSDSEELLLSAK